MKVAEKYTSGDVVQILFYCPGCEMHHGPWVEGNNVPIWKWNGSLEKPTFSPSLLVKGGTYKSGEYIETQCHSYVKNGKIQFLNDCSHEFAGRTIELEPFDDCKSSIKIHKS
ncbi:DUF6527 family protein [Gracilimonas tropica]|uniref:DUF6527 family protein n=1 Tax=Gracilimonas tropica TaxID=454600 RepID=UPI00037363AE|nr:DUF6527 family protein [Gracilimonas tropica]